MAGIPLNLNDLKSTHFFFRWFNPLAQHRKKTTTLVCPWAGMQTHHEGFHAGFQPRWNVNAHRCVRCWKKAAIQMHACFKDNCTIVFNDPTCVMVRVTARPRKNLKLVSTTFYCQCAQCIYLCCTLPLSLAPRSKLLSGACRWDNYSEGDPLRWVNRDWPRLYCAISTSFLIQTIFALTCFHMIGLFC